MASGTIWIPVAPSFRGFGTAMIKEATGASRAAADRIDSDLSRAGQSAGSKAGKGIADGVKASAAQVEKATRQVVQARKRESDAAANVTLAEAKLADSRAKGASADRIATQETALTSARRKQESAAGLLADAEGDLESVRKGEPGRAQALIRSSSQVENARVRAADASDRVRLAEEKLDRVQSDTGSTATQVATAQAQLTRAKSNAASATDVLRGKEQLHEATLEEVEQQANQTGDAVEDAGKKADHSGGLMSKAATGAKNLALGLGAVAAAGATVAMKGGLDTAMNIGAATRSLTGLHGSAETAADTIERVGKVSRDSSIEHKDYTEFAKNLAYIGVEGAQLESIMNNAGQAVVGFGGDGSNLERINGALASMVNNGKVNREELSRLSDAGIPIFEGLASQMGVSVEELNKIVSTGVIGIEDVLSVMEDGTGDYFGQLLDAGSEMEQGLGATWARLKDNLKLDIGNAIVDSGVLNDMVPVLERLGDALLNVVGWVTNDLIPALMDMVTWIRDNKDLLSTLTIALVSGVAAFMAYQKALVAVTAAKKLYATATLIADKGMKGLNATMKANVIGLIVAAVAALVAGLIWFFTQTETGQRLWESFTNALSAGWEWVKEAFASAWAVIQPILSGIWEAIKIVGAVVATVVLGVIMVYWNLLSAYLSFVWENIIKPVFSAIQVALQAVGDFFGWVWTTLIKPAWDALGAGIAWVWNTLIRPAWDALKVALGAVGSFFQWVWNSIIKPAWNALGAGISWVWQNVISPAWDALKAALGVVGDFFKRIWNSVIKPVWDALGDGIRSVIDSVIKPAWDGLKSALGSVGDFFSTIVEGIRETWDKMKGHVAKPINFVIETVWNEGLLAAWDAIAGFLPGLPNADGARLSPVAFAEGGKVPFVSGAKRGQDSVNAILMPDEHVLDVNDVRSVGGHGNVYAMRHFLDQGRPFMFDGSGGLAGLPRNPDHSAGDLAGAAPDLLIPRYADGGAVRRRIERDENVRPAWMDQLVRGHEFASRVAPGPYVLGGSSGGVPGGPTDCSGYLSEIGDVIIGGPGGTRQWATGNFPGPQEGAWAPGLGPGFSVGIVHGGPAGGHTAGTLSAVDHYGAVNVESGGGTGQGATYGGAAQGADGPSFTEQHHLKIGADGAFESGGGPSMAQQMSLLRQKVQEILDKALDPIREAMGAVVGTPPPEWLGIPPAALDETKTAAVDTAFDFIENLGDKLRSAYDLAKDVVTTVTGFFTGGINRDTGGILPQGQSLVNNETGKPEQILNWDQIQQVIRLAESAQGAAALQAWALGDPRQALRMGVEQGTVDAIEKMGVDLATEIHALGEIGRDSFINSTRDDVLDFFGFKGLADGIDEVWDAFNQPPQAASRSAISTSGPTSTGGGVTVHGDPNAVYQTKEVALETQMPDLDRANPPGEGAERWRSMMVDALKNQGMDDWANNPEIVDRFVRQIDTESGGDPNIAQQIVDVNGTGEAAGVGLGQAIPGTWAEYRDPELPDDRRNGWAMLNFMARYVRQKYGPQGYTNIGNGIGYDQGGIANGIGFLAKATLRPERVLDPNQTQAFEDWLEAGTSDGTLEVLSGIPSAQEFESVLARVTEESEGRSGGGGPMVYIEKLEARDESEAMAAAHREARRMARSSGLAGGRW